ncbi:MAG: sensor histidine kinase [Chthonomonadales bacterium]
MKPRSLRARLALWHAGLLALTLVVLAALTLILLRRFLHSRADKLLEDYADQTARSIAVELYQSSLQPRPERPRFLNKELQEWSRQIQVVDAYNNVVDRSDGLASHTLPTSMDARVNALKGRTTFETFYDLGEHPVRVVTVPVQMGHDVPYLVQAAASLEGVDDALRRASLILVVLTPSVFVVSLLGGWILVGRSLRPVDEITRTALAIEHTNLDRRIAEPATDDEIARLASAFNEMIARLDRSFRQIQQFSADASHELKTPLTSIRGEAEVALMAELTPEGYRAVLRSIVDEVERMSAIVENLLILARADAHQIQVRRERVALHEMVMSVYEQMEPLARRRGVSLEIGPMVEAEVEGDPLWLPQILINLVNNAVKYTPAGGTVTVSVTTLGLPSAAAPAAKPDAVPQKPPTALIAVEDTGPGIPPEHLPHIFDRFYRVDAGRSRDAGGVGLGLNIAKWAAEAHGGTITVQSEIGKGSVFTVELPLALN